MYEARNPVEDRFAFSARGTFRCSRATERISVIISLVITVIAFAGFYYVWGRQFIYIALLHYDDLIGLSESQRMGFSPISTTHTFFFAMAFALIVVIIVIGEIVALRIILGGVKYNYSADSNIFSFRSQKDNVRKTDIHYNDVIAVRYEERKLFGFIKRGLTVTIISRSLGNVTLLYIRNKSDKECKPENTPFHIIEERIDVQNARRQAGEMQ